MVRQRKQRKPNSAEGDRSEVALTIQSCRGTRSPLVALPAELQGIIISHVSTSLCNDPIYVRSYAYGIALACSIPGSQSPLLYLQDPECGCSPYTLPHYRVEGSAAMELAPFAGKASCIFIGRFQVYQMPEDSHETIPSRRQCLPKP